MSDDDRIDNYVAHLTRQERLRQLDIWGEQNHPDGTSVANAEIADLAKDSCERAFNEGRGTYLDILLEEVMEASAEVDDDKLVAELIQVAAVAESWVEAIRRRVTASIEPLDEVAA